MDGRVYAEASLRKRAKDALVCLLNSQRRHTRAVAWTKYGVLWVFVLPLLVWSQLAYSQYSSNLEGQVTDPSHAVIPNATVQMLNTATQVSQSLTTDSGGNYRFNSLAPGDYEVTVSAVGFNPQTIKLTLQTGQTANLPVTLTLAGTRQTVEVTSQAALLDTADSRLQETVGSQELHAMPLQGRNFLGLASVTPGVTGLGVIVGTAPGSCSSGLASTIPDNFATELPVEASANGKTLLSNMFLLDGLDVTSNVDGGNLNLTPNPDSIQEVTTETNDFSVEYGRNSSIIIKMTTKSGTDQYHGNLGDYFTNQHLWARSEFTGPSYAPFESHNLSASVGGPLIPHRHNYFFASIEPLRSTFSTGNQAYTFEDPQFVQWAEQNFPNTIGTKLLENYPIKTSASGVVTETAQAVFPTTCGTAAAANIPCNLAMIDTGTYEASPYRNGLEWNARIDTYFAKDRLYGNFYRMTHNDQTPSIRTGFDTTNLYDSDSLQVNETHTFSARTLNEAMFGYARPEGFMNRTGTLSVPYITVVGMSSTFGIGFADGDFIQHNYRWRDVLTMVRGTHTLKFGYDGWHGDELSIFAPTYSNPAYQFNSLLELVEDDPYSQTGLAYNPLTGKPTGGNHDYAKTSAGAFAEDIWKAKSGLTLTLGIRWDDFGNTYPAPGSVLADFFLGAGSTPAEQVANGVMKQVSHLYKHSINVFSPRIGLAWDPTGKGDWAVRGGFGVYHDWMTLGADDDNLAGNPPGPVFPTFLRGTTTPPVLALGTSNTYPFGFPYPALPATTLDAHGGLVGDELSVGGMNPNLGGQRTYNYSFSLERRLPGRLMASIGYSGSHSYDQLTGCGTAQGCEGTDINRFPGDLIINDDVLTRLNPSFGSIQYTTNGVRTAYNALILSVEKRYSTRGVFTAAYTRSSSWWDGGYYPDQNDISQYWQPALFNAPNRFSFSGSYSVGTPKGGPRPLNYLARGWELSTNTILQAGYPFTVSTNAPFEPIFNAAGTQVIGMQPGSGDYQADGYNYAFPDVPSFGYKISNTSHQAFLNGVFPASAFPVPTMGTYGDLKPGLYTGPGFASVDLGLIKDNPITERVNLQLRFEFFNVLNHPNLNRVDGNLPDATFGQSTSVFNPRWLQVAMKLTF